MPSSSGEGLSPSIQPRNCQIARKSSTSLIANGLMSPAPMFALPARRAVDTGHPATTAGCLALLDAMKRQGVVVRNLADIGTMLALLRSLGAETAHDRERKWVRVRAANIARTDAPAELVAKMRASFLVAGELVRQVFLACRRRPHFDDERQGIFVDLEAVRVLGVHPKNETHG